MQVYRCDVSGRDLTWEDVQKCEAKKLEYSTEKALTTFQYELICQQAFHCHPDYLDLLDSYWDDKQKVVEELNQNWASRITNHRKSFFHKPKKKDSKAAIEVVQ